MDYIKELENLTSMIAHDKANILLVYGDLKPSCLAVISGDVYDQTKEPVHVSASLIDHFTHILDGLNLSFELETVVYKDEGASGTEAQEVVRAYIAKDQATADTLKNYFSDLENHHQDVGMMLGYPETAVKAFLTQDMLDMADTPESTKDVSKENMQLLGYRLSKAHWEEEVKPLEAQGKYLKALSPVIYKLITE